MKWIGQHIWDFISRFRSDVYFEDLNTTTESNILVADSDGKVSKRTASGLTSGKVTVTDSTANTEFPVVFHDESDGLLDDTGSFTYNPNFQTLTMISGASNLPGILLENTNTDNKPPQIKFLKDAGEAGADGDYTGTINFYGDNSAQEETWFGAIRNRIVTALDTDEAARMEMITACSNGTSGSLGNVIAGIGHGTNNTVDIELGSGASSTTTVAGNLVVTSDLTVSGITTTINTTNLNVEDKQITLNYADGHDTSGTADEAGIHIQDAVDASNDAHFIWNASTDNWRLSHGLDISNGASSGVPNLILDNDDTDQIALDIDASNINNFIVDIDGSALTTHYGINMSLASITSGGGLRIDWDDTVTTDTNRSGNAMVHLDYDKSGAVAPGQGVMAQGLLVQMNDAATNAGDMTMYGVNVIVDSASTNGITTNYAFKGIATDADANYGLWLQCEDGAGSDIKLHSSADMGDYFSIATGADGVTTLTTVDDDAADAHIEIVADGDVVLDSVGDIDLDADGEIGLRSDGDMRFTIDQDNNASNWFTWYSNGTPHGSRSIMNLSDTGELLVGGPGSTSPKITIADYADDANGSELLFKKSRGNPATDAQDDDQIGLITFTGYDDGTPSEQTYATIAASIQDASDGAEEGKMTFSVASHDGEMQPGLVLKSGDAEDKVDVVIGNGSSSLTYTDPNLTHSGSFTIFGTSALNLASGGQAVVDGVTGVLMNKSGTNLGFFDTANLTMYGTAAGPASIDLREDTDNGTNAIKIIAPASCSDQTITLPDATGTVQLQGENTGQVVHVNIRDNGSYLFYMYNDDYWYSAGSTTLAILGLGSSPGDISSANSEFQGRAACYTAMAACTLKKLTLTFYWTSTVVNSADIDFAFSKSTPITDGTAATITMNSITATDHDGVYTENKPYQKTFTFSGGNATLAAGDCFHFHVRTTGGQSAQRVIIYGSAVLSLELD